MQPVHAHRKSTFFVPFYMEFPCFCRFSCFLPQSKNMCVTGDYWLLVILNWLKEWVWACVVVFLSVALWSSGPHWTTLQNPQTHIRQGLKYGKRLLQEDSRLCTRDACLNHRATRRPELMLFLEIYIFKKKSHLRSGVPASTSRATWEPPAQGKTLTTAQLEKVNCLREEGRKKTYKMNCFHSKI